MANSAGEILKQALSLSADERIRLAHDLLESVDTEDVDDFSAEWIEEIGRRVQRVVAGDASADEDWRVVLGRIRGRGAERSA